MATLKSLLPAVTLFAHWMPWFGQSNHKDVGYDSADSGTISYQCRSMKQYGIDGVIPDWYGFDPSQAHSNLATLRMLRECETQGLKFAICIDGGAIKPYASAATARVVDLIKYVLNTFAISDAYWDINNKPVILFFGDSSFTIDWAAVRAQIGPANLIFRNKGGFTHAESDGAFSWLSTANAANDPASLAYLYDFYTHRDATKISIGSIYPGFYDPNPKDPTKSVWDINTPVRTIDYRNGVTFLDTCLAVPPDIQYVQVVTWNDREEGSDIETNLKPWINKLLSQL